MEESLRTSLNNYIVLAEQKLRGETEDRLRSSVEGLETTPAFHALVHQTKASFKHDDFELVIGNLWEHRVGTFFRLSGTYTACAAADALSTDDLFLEYCSAFQAGQHTRRILAPLEFVELSKDSMDFGAFMLHRFTSEELDNIFQNRMRRIFYPYAVVNSDTLSEYWCVSVREPVASEWPNPSEGNVWDSRVRVSYSRHPSAVQTALRLLALFNWGSNPFGPAPADTWPIQREDWDGPFVPRAPFVLSVTDSLIIAPAPPPDLLKLATEPVLNHESGEYLGDKRESGLVMNGEETAGFERFITQVVALAGTIEPHRSEWTFIDTALGFLLKALATDGLEQLLWHVTTIEAVLGQDVAGVTRLLSSRVSAILGQTTEERRDLEKRFRHLYSFRSNLVHGNASLAKSEIHLRHLGEARDYARRIVLWMLHYLQAAINATPAGEPMPTRDQLLALLDLDAEGCRQSARLLQNLPPGFPSVPNWR